MRRTFSTLGTLAAAATLVVTMPAAAHAAHGSLFVNGVQYENPHSGCHHVPHSGPGVWVVNNTDEDVLVYSSADCRGAVSRVFSHGDFGPAWGSAFFVRGDHDGHGPGHGHGHGHDHGPGFDLDDDEDAW
ncbi:MULTISPECIES: hypothetical protein [Streptomycetaceae]|uniref:Uncharacterized protein n=1 Tax=Streptantibioticus cattleyicolor (strain ATCC 35852 / DSM 46488 / JCM 4925 / NBRC 14057 / NRRL 8057) TaxID=1003195 RepID=F8JVG1_STREN|nr:MULTISPECIES: hypothetical protein [Streptomycetaceae]AEW94447.1 hypothetical protein SCATT_20760 [Streptantibioticus cattleyicolor NRRL 8057 = DSM 46488]MYS59094.1 hypothetical protein [Streptomyces sp. SID5468]CCB74804.1 exported protein of unknown function [Streptantibioticus cattleyicolor NRRL 8057 = DSM 46488]